MTSLAYEVTRGGLLRDRVSREGARELFARALAEPRSELAGDAVAGFGYWVVDPEGIKLVRVRVEPVG